MLRIIILCLVSFKCFAFYPIESYPDQDCDSVSQQQEEFDGMKPKGASIKEGEILYLIKRIIHSYQSRSFYQCNGNEVITYSFSVKFLSEAEAVSTYEEWLDLNTNKFGKPNKSIEESWPIKTWNLKENILLGLSLDSHRDSWRVSWGWHR